MRHINRVKNRNKPASPLKTCMMCFRTYINEVNGERTRCDVCAGWDDEFVPIFVQKPLLVRVREGLHEAMQDIKSGRTYSIDEFWSELDRDGE